VRVSILAILAAILASSACVLSAAQVPTATPTVSPPPASPTPTPAPTATERPRTTEEAVNTVTIRAVVWIRSEPDGVRIGSLETGQSVELIGCDGDWCEVRTDVLSGYVFRGCTSDNPDELECEAKP
jgi:hypothetical protein